MDGGILLKRVFHLLAAVLAVCLLCRPAHAVTTNASCAILMDAESGRVLYAQNIHEPRLIASITKLMTALVAVERTEDLDQTVTIKGEWLGSEGSSIYLTAGEKITVRGLLYGLLLQSGNDAAMAIACHVAGDMETFVGMMNEKARELGMNNSSFANPSGLNDENHYSTAYDMALLACACLDNEAVAEICATRSVTVGTRTFVNHNKLLYRYEGCVGMKTGYTELAGRTLVSAARRDGQTLVCVTLNDGSDWNDHAKLLDYGFETYPRSVLCEAGQGFGTIAVEGSLVPALPVAAACEAGYPLAEGEGLTLEVELADIAAAPVAVGAEVGTAVWSLDGQPVASVPLVCAAGADRDVCQPLSLWQRFLSLFGAPAAHHAGVELV